jgi:hypothetical protein
VVPFGEIDGFFRIEDLDCHGHVHVPHRPDAHDAGADGEELVHCFVGPGV